MISKNIQCLIILVILFLKFALNCPVGDTTPSFQQQSIENETSRQPLFKLSLIPTPAPKIAESVNLEHEAIPSKILTAYDNSQKKFSDLTYSAPVLDSVSPTEKFDSKANLLHTASRSIVNGYEAFSNLLNKIIDKHQEVARKISKKVTTRLDVIGGKLVGL